MASWSCSGMPEQHPDDPHRHLGAEIGDEVEAVGSRRADRGPRRSTARICGSRAFIFFGVKTRDSTPRWAVCMGGSSMMNTPVGGSMLALISSRTPPRAELNVPWSTKAALDVVEAADGVEVVRLVVVERRLLPQAPEDRVRVGVDVEVVGVVVDVAFGRDGHRIPCSSVV